MCSSDRPRKLPYGIWLAPLRFVDGCLAIALLQFSPGTAVEYVTTHTVNMKIVIVRYVRSLKSTPRRRVGKIVRGPVDVWPMFKAAFPRSVCRRGIGGGAGASGTGKGKCVGSIFPPAPAPYSAPANSSRKSSNIHTQTNKQTRLPEIDRIWFQKGGSVGPIVNRSTAIFCRNFPLVTPNIHRKIWKTGERTVWEKNCRPSEKCSQIWPVSLWNFLICIWRYEHPGVFKGVIVWGAIVWGQLSWGAIVLGGQFPRGNCLGGNHPGVVVQGVIVRGAVVQGVMVQGVIV